MSLQELLDKAEQITTTNRMNEIIQEPRTGKVYIYHQGMIADDKSYTKKMDEKEIKKRRALGEISYLVNHFAEKKLIMPFQKKIGHYFYTYFFVR